MKKKNGEVTILEMLIIMIIVSILFGMVSLSLLNLRQKTSINSAIPQITTDIKNQQLKAMIGDMENGTIADNYGIYFESQKYILFKGTIFNAADPLNFSIDLETPLQFTDIRFPSNVIIFQKGSGEIVGFIGNQNSFTVNNPTIPEQKIITLNRYGVISSTD